MSRPLHPTAAPRPERMRSRAEAAPSREAPDAARTPRPRCGGAGRSSLLDASQTHQQRAERAGAPSP